MNTKKIILFLIIVFALPVGAQNTKNETMNIYDFTVKDAKGNDVPMTKYRGKVLLIVNTATECGFTPQYKDLQNLYSKYKDQGFEVLDFPCNQFAHQAPGTNEEIASFCELNYKTSFDRFAKIDVNGKDADPLYNYLKENTKNLLGGSIKWNFTKFLIARDGTIIHRYAPTTNPSSIEDDIEKQLNIEDRK